MLKRYIKYTFLLLGTVLFLVGCEQQPKIFMDKEEVIRLKQEENLKKKVFEETEEQTLYKNDSKEYELLQKETKLNPLTEKQMIQIARDLMKQEIKIYSLPNNKEAFDEWVKKTYLHPEENEFLRYYRELGNYEDVKILFYVEDLDGEKRKLERVNKLGKTGFLYHGIMTLKGVNKNNKQEEMAILNLILHIDKAPNSNEYKIVKMGGSTANTVIHIPDQNK